MGHAAYGFEDGGPKRLEVDWRIGWKDFVVRFDGSQVASFPGELPVAGAATPLPDGSNLELALFRGTANGTVLELKRDGIALGGGGPVVDTEGQMRTAARWLYFAAGLSFVVGAVTQLAEEVSPTVKLFAIGFLFVYCVVLAVLGYFVGRGSMAAAITAFAVFVIDWVATLLLTHNPLAGILIRILVLVALYRAIKKMRDLKNLKDAAAVFS
jgi:hypothetical protein